LFQLNQEDNQLIVSLLEQLQKCYESPSDEEFVREARVYASQLPLRMISQLNCFRCTEAHNGTLLFRGFEVCQLQMGATPERVGKEIDERSAAREGFLLMVQAAFLGDPMGWANQRQGALLNNVLPLKNHEAEQLSTGSMADLDWHSEEAFHPFRADFMGLMCLRNPDAVPTIVGSIQDVTIPDPVRRILFEPRFVFHLDNNFRKEGNRTVARDPVLFGDYSSPYVRIDPSFMSSVEGDEEAAVALKYIIEAFDSALQYVVMKPGDILFIDNYRVVHGRKGFKPRFDGTDRWLKRINITLDLRKSRAKRQFQHSRVIITD
jgi:Fe(II)/alpha-ketoglutarate-dependent arginine beta-hydroxylase